MSPLSVHQTTSPMATAFKRAGIMVFIAAVLAIAGLAWATDGFTRHLTWDDILRINRESASPSTPE